VKVHVCGLWQETNTFCPHKTNISNFESGYLFEGRDALDQLAHTNTELWGALEFLATHGGVEADPGVAAWASPSGPIIAPAYAVLTQKLLSALRRCLPVDGVILCLHGAMAGDHLDDCEGDLLMRVRQLVGAGTPVVASLDYHACVTEQMMRNADVLVGYRTFPHVDYAETGSRAAAALMAILKDRFKPKPQFVKLPLILPSENTETGAGPMESVIRQLKQLDHQPDVVSASVFCCQPWLDVPEHGASVLVYTQQNSRRANDAAEIARGIWSARDYFYQKYPSIDDFLADAHRQKKPIGLADAGDITSGGAAGDGTVVLRALLDAGRDLRSILTIIDPDTVRQAVEIGCGGVGRFFVGGREDRGYNGRVRLTARIANITDAKVRFSGAVLHGMEIDPGRRVLLDIDGRVHILVCERTTMVHDPEFLRASGTEPRAYDLIVQKANKMFRGGYGDILGTFLSIDTPGCTDMNLTRLPFHRVSRPIWPLDVFEWQPPTDRGAEQ
jgi:microcystin degradation protein MlrC